MAAACVMAMSWATLPVLSQAADKLYYFVDERGTPHFSNVPTDKRYRPYLVIVEDGASNAGSVGPREPLPAHNMDEDDAVQHEPDTEPYAGDPADDAPPREEDVR
jgi:hypothetical protein